MSVPRRYDLQTKFVKPRKRHRWVSIWTILTCIYICSIIDTEHRLFMYITSFIINICIDEILMKNIIIANYVYFGPITVHDLPSLCASNVVRFNEENGFTLNKVRSRRYFVKTNTDVDYTDDIALLANTPAQAESLLHSLEKAAGGIDDPRISVWLYAFVGKLP